MVYVKKDYTPFSCVWCMNSESQEEHRVAGLPLFFKLVINNSSCIKAPRELFIVLSFQQGWLPSDSSRTLHSAKGRKRCLRQLAGGTWASIPLTRGAHLGPVPGSLQPQGEMVSLPAYGVRLSSFLRYLWHSGAKSHPAQISWSFIFTEDASCP